MAATSHNISQVRSWICNTFLIAAAVAAVPALAGSLYRIPQTGWLPIMSVQLGLFAALWSLVLLRKRVPYALRAGFIVLGLMTLGLGGLWQVGLVGSAVVFLVVAPALSAIFFSTRVGLIVLFTAVASTMIIGLYTTLRHKLPPFDPSAYATEFSSWVSMIVGWSLVAATLLAALIMYNRGLNAALRDANRTEEELSRRVDERTRDLTREISERRAVEAELRKAEAALVEANESLETRIEARTRELNEEKERFRSIVENSPVELSLKNTDGTYTVINPVARSLYDRSGEVADGKTAYDFWPRKFADELAEHDRAVVESGRALTFEDILPTHRGGRIMKTTKFPVRNPDGEVTGIGTIGIDITREREAEIRLRESEERFRALFENSPNAISLKDIEGRFLLVNAKFEASMGIHREDIIGKKTDDIFEGDFAMSGKMHDQQVVKRKQSVQSDERLERDGRTYRFSTTKFPILDGDGNVTAIAAVHTDLTKRMQAEEALSRRESEYRQLVELNPDAVIVQCDGRIVLANKSACEMFGAESTGDLIGLDALSIVHPDFRNVILQQRNLVVRDQVAVAPLETRHQRIDGTWFYSEFTAGPVVWNGRRATINLIRDVTRRRKTEEQLHQAQKMEAVGHLTGGVAHDFNNLLAIILGNVDELRDRVPGEQRQQVDAVIRAAERGAELTRRLLAFSRQQVLEPKVIDVGSVLADMTKLLQRTLGEHIEIQTSTPGGLWHCEVDPAQLENALVNLGINARDAMPEGGRLTIETTNADLSDSVAAAEAGVAPGQYVLITVTDTGSGMSPEIREQVFEPFFTTKEAGKGTGLGLSMIFGFVKQSGGHVAIESALGEGTSVRIYLPRYKGDKAVAETQRIVDSADNGRGELILVVEDDVDLRATMVGSLRSLGYEVLEADTAEMAFTVLAERPDADLLLTDVVLPAGKNGRILAEKARERLPHLRVLFVSGYTGDAITRHWRLDEGVQLLEKPFRAPELASAVRKALR